MGPGFEDAMTRNGPDEGLLQVISAEFPRLQVLYVHGGYIALPRDVQVTTATNTGRLLEKLRAERDGTPIGLVARSRRHPPRRSPLDPSSPALAMLRLTTAVLLLGMEVAAGDLAAQADAEALADLMEQR